jgi:hypothetical protein
MDDEAAKMEAKLALKLSKKQEKKEAKEKARRQSEAEENIMAIEAKKLDREMDRTDEKAAESARKLSPSEQAANEAAFFLEYQTLVQGRKALKKAEHEKAEVTRLALMPNPARDWKCNGCNYINKVVPGSVATKAKSKKKKKKKKKKRGDDSDSSDSDFDDEKAAAAEEEAPPEPVTRCFACGVPHTYMPRGRKGLGVLALNALTEAYDALSGDGWTSKKGWLRALKLSDWHGIKVVKATTNDDDDAD